MDWEFGILKLKARWLAVKLVQELLKVCIMEASALTLNMGKEAVEGISRHRNSSALFNVEPHGVGTMLMSLFNAYADCLQ